MKALRWLVRWMVGIAIVMAVVGVTAVFLPQYEQLKRLSRDRDRLQQEIARQQDRLLELRRNRERFQTDRDFVEQVARQARRAWPGEVVFIYPDQP